MQTQEPSGTTSNNLWTRRQSIKNEYNLLLLLRIIENEQILDFRIMQDNDDIGGEFGDITVHIEYKSSEGEETNIKIFCIHILNEETEELNEGLVQQDGYQQLLEYCIHFKKIPNADGIIPVIYTNANCFGADGEQMVEDYFHDLMKARVGKSNACKFNNSTVINNFSKIVQTEEPYCLQEDWISFLDRLVVFTKQSTDLKSMIIGNLRKYITEDNLFNFYNTAIQFIADNRRKWLSWKSTVFCSLKINYQGIDVPLNKDKFVARKFKKIVCYGVVASICNIKNISIGKPIPNITDYYVYQKLYKPLRVKKRIFCYDSFNKERLVLISGHPGVGKTFGFVHQALLLKNKNIYQHKWVVCQNLLDYEDYLKSINLDTNKKEIAKDFLKIVSMNLKPNPSGLYLENDLFECCLHGNRTMVVFLDNIDKLNKSAFQNTIALINVIRVEYNIQMYVCMRHTHKNQLENDFKVKSWELDGFSQTQQILFVKEYACESQLESPVWFHSPLLCKLIQDSINEQRTRYPMKIYPDFILKLFVIFSSNDSSMCAGEGLEWEEKKNYFIKSLSEIALLTIFTDDELNVMNVNIKENCMNFYNEITENKEHFKGLLIEMHEERPTLICENVAAYLCAVWFHSNQMVYKSVIDHKHRVPQKVDYYTSFLYARGTTLFELILYEQYVELQEALYNEVVDVNCLDSIGRSALAYVVQKRTSDKALKILLSNGLKVSTIDHVYFDRKHWFLFSCFALAKWVKFLHDCNIDVCLFLQYLIHVDGNCLLFYLLTQKGNSPLHMSILRGQESKTEKFIAENQFINAENEQGFTPLHIAISKIDIDTIKKLTDKDVEYKKNIFGMFPHQCHRIGHEAWDLQRYKTMIKSPEELQSRINQNTYSENEFPLFYLIQNNKLNDAMLLLHQDAVDVNQRDENGLTALHVAVTVQSSSTVELVQLLMKYPDVQYIADAMGYFPHDYATSFYLRRLLLDFGFMFKLNALEDKYKTIFNIGIEEFVRRTK